LTEAVAAPLRTIVFGEDDAAGHLGPRTRRSLARAGLLTQDATLGEALESAAGAVWLVRAGAWRARRGPISFPPSSRTGRPLCALGAILPLTAAPDEDEARWAETLAATGGDLDGRRLSPLPPPASVYLEGPLARALGPRLAGGAPFEAALEDTLRASRARVVRYPPLDVHAGRALRVAQVVTSLQQGGAERVALSLAQALPKLGAPTLLVALGGPTRASFAAPPGLLDLAWQRRLDREARIVPLLQALDAFGADVVHAHLLEGNEVRRLGTGGIPLVATIHNVREGWPVGTEELRAADATLLVACARAVEPDLRALLGLPVRTVWNGVDFGPDAAPAGPAARAAAWRRQLGLGADDLGAGGGGEPAPAEASPVSPPGPGRHPRRDGAPGQRAAVHAS
jgi:hypothetical protein